jgi:hypothetical protein
MPICGWASTAIKPREREETTFRGRKDNKPDNTRDPWVALGHRPTTLQSALHQMGAAAMH